MTSLPSSGVRDAAGAVERVDDDLIVFVERHYPRLIRLAGLVCRNPAYLTGAPAWSPDGPRLAVALGGCPGPAGAGCPSPVWILDVAAGEWTPMGEPGDRREGEHFGSVRWSPDGSRAAVLTTYPGAEPASSDRLSIATAIRIVDVDGQLVGEPIIEVFAEAFDAADGGGLASGEMIPSAPAWAPDGDELYYVSLRPRHASELRALPVGGGESMLMADDVETFAVAGY
jgi:hypothetical protein